MSSVRKELSKGNKRKSLLRININIPKHVIGQKKQFIVNHNHRSTKMATGDAIEASTVTTPQTWNRDQM